MALIGVGIPQKSIRFGDCELNASASNFVAGGGR